MTFYPNETRTLTGDDYKRIQPGFDHSFTGGWSCNLSAITALKQHFASGVYNETKFMAPTPFEAYHKTQK